MKHKFLALIFVVSLGLPQLAFSNSDVTYNQDSFSTGLEWDALFESIFIWDWDRTLSDNMSVNGEYLVAPTYSTMALFFHWYYTLESFKFGLGLGASVGRGSFGIQQQLYPERHKVFLARELIPKLYLNYSNSFADLTAASSFWIPTQESHNTALWILFAQFYAAFKFDSFKIGPMIEAQFLKEGQRSLDLVGLWTGGKIVKQFEKFSFHLFLGYDPIEVNNFLGGPKEGGYVARALAFYAF